MSSRVALISEAGNYVGPALARALAASGHDLALVGASAEQHADLEALGNRVVGIEAIETKPGGDPDPEGWRSIVARTLDHFGRLDAAAISPRSLGPISHTSGQRREFVGCSPPGLVVSANACL